VDPKRPSHFLIREPNSQGYRAFTPLLQYDENDGQCGDEMDFIIRTYQRPFGEVANYICKRKQGEHLLVHGPHYDADIYHLYDYFKQQQHRQEKHDFGFVANGTGITAVYQVLQWLPSYLAKGSRISVLYSDRSVDDLVLKKDLEQLKQKFKHVSFDFVYFVPDQTFSKDSKEDNIVRGRIGVDALKKHLPKPSKSQTSIPKVFVCGSPNLMRSLCGEREENGAQGKLQGHFKALGYNSNEVFKF
jgi:cytochrome-b5 reductase